MLRSRLLRLIAVAALMSACEPAEEVRIQELPSLARSSVEARLGLPELRGPWRFAGWELAEGDTLGLDAELPSFGILWLQTQKRDSLAGLYLTAGGGRAPLQGEVRRDGVVALVAFPEADQGRYLVGEVEADTIWVEGTTLAEAESWRSTARAAFVRSESPVTPFRRVRGAVAATAAVDSAALAAGIDSLPRVPAGTLTTTPPASATSPATGARPSTAQPARPSQPPAGAAPTPTPRAETPAPVTPPVTEPVQTEEPVEAEPQPEPEPQPQPEPEPAEEPDRPRVLGVPVERDTAGGDRLP